jgi:hypothetical protein
VSWFNVKAPAYGALGNGNITADAAMTATSATLTSASANFTSADVGKLVQVRGAGAVVGSATTDLNTTISAYVSATQVTLATAARTTVSAAQLVYGSNDSTAIQAAITAAAATNYGTVYLPPGVYFLGTALVVQNLMRITGQNALIVTTNCGAINFSSVYLSPHDGVFGRTAGFELDHLQFDVTGGHALWNLDLNGASFHNLVLTQRSAAYAAVHHDVTGTNLISTSFNDIVTNVYGNPRTIQAWHLVSHVGGGLALSKWTRCSFSNEGADNAEWLMWTEARGGAGGGTIGNYTNGLAFDSCTFSSAFGGCLNLLSVQGAVVTNARIVNTSSGGTVAQSMYHVGTNTGSGASLFTSQGVSFIGCGRDLPAVDGVHHFDIDLDASADMVTIVNYENRWRTTDTLRTPFFNLNGARHVTILNCPTAQLTNPGNAIQIPACGQDYTDTTGDGVIALAVPLAITSGGTGSRTQNFVSSVTEADASLTNSGTALARVLAVTPGLVPAIPGPAGQGLIAWSMDPFCCTSNNVSLTFGTLFMIRLTLSTAARISNVLMSIHTLGGTLTSGENYVGLYSTAGVLLGVSADQTAHWMTGGTSGNQTMALTATSSGSLTGLPIGGVYVAILCNGSATAPAVVGGSSSPGGAAVNLGQTATPAGLRYGSITSSGYTSLPSRLAMSGLGQPTAGPILVGLS